MGHAYQATIHDRNSDNTQCPICNAKSQTSFLNRPFFFYVKNLYPDAINRYKEIFERPWNWISMFPPFVWGIEFDGANWHNPLHSSNERKKKYDVCKANQITLIRVKENVESR